MTKEHNCLGALMSTLKELDKEIQTTGEKHFAEFKLDSKYPSGNFFINVKIIQQWSSSCFPTRAEKSFTSLPAMVKWFLAQVKELTPTEKQLKSRAKHQAEQKRERERAAYFKDLREWNCTVGPNGHLRRSNT